MSPSINRAKARQRRSGNSMAEWSSELLTNAKNVQERLVIAKLRALVDDGDRCRQNLPPRRAYRCQR
jgi:hypothetical protein